MKLGTESIMANLRANIAAPVGTSVSAAMASVNMLSFLKPVNGRTTASFRVATTNPTMETLASNVKQFFGNELEMVAGSIKVVESSDFFTTICGHIKRAHVARAVSPDGTMPNGFVTLSKNIFMEERDSTTWKLVTEGGNKVLVRDSSVETDEDMAQILSSLSSAGQEHTPAAKHLYAQASALVEGIETGALVVHATEEDGVALAYAIEGMGEDGSFGAVALTGNGQYVDLHASAVVQIIPSTQYLESIHTPATDSVALASGGRVDANVLVEYYKKVFGYNKEFFKQWSDRLRNQFAC